MKKLFFLAGVALLSFQTMYAYSPLEQSAGEISDIVNSRELRRYLPPYESIMNIRRVSNGYVISTNHYQLFVEVRYRPRAGEVKEDEKKAFDLKFSEATQSNQ